MPKDSDKSLLPPSGWFSKVKKEVAATPKYKGYSDERIDKIVAGIWYELSESKRKEIRQREGKEYGPAPKSHLQKAIAHMTRTGITLTYEELGPGKFSNSIDEWVYEQSMEGADEEIGSADELGWYGLLLFKEPVEVIDRDGGEWSFLAAILSESGQGFANVSYFDTEAEAREEWAGIEREYVKYYEEVGEEAY